MNAILMNVSAAAVVTAIFKILIPDDKNNKQIKLLLSCFFIITVMNVVKGNYGFDWLNNAFDISGEYNDYSMILEKQTADEAANALRTQIKSELLKENITPEKIYIDINISRSGSISFNEIRLVFYDTDSEAAERAVRITEQCVGNEITVSLEEP